MQLLILDTETTGFPRKLDAPIWTQPEIIEFAGKLYDTEAQEVTADYEQQFRTKQSVPPFIEELLHIKDSDLNGKPIFKDCYEDLKAFCAKADCWVAHNLLFDKKMMTFEVIRCGKGRDFPWPEKEFCTMKYSRSTFIHGGHKLRDLHYRLAETPVIQTHRAMDDVNMLLDIIHYLVVEKIPLVN